MNVLLIDSEGYGALDEDSNHDTRVFALGVLLSSCFIYNSVGSIDENAIQNLSLVVNLTKTIHVKSQQQNEDMDVEDYSIYFPTFIWIVRDFTLQLVNAENEPISSKEYLEMALAQQKGVSENIEAKNKIRRYLTGFFKDRDCVTLIRPLTNEENLQNLDKMDFDKLRPEFFEQVINLRKKVLNRMRPKTLNQKLLTGEMFAGLIKSYVSAINNGAVPNIENAWIYICILFFALVTILSLGKNECNKAVSDAIDLYYKTIKDIIGNKVPMTLEELKSFHKIAKETAICSFKKKAIGEIFDEYLKELLKKIKQKFTILRNENDKESLVCFLPFLAYFLSEDLHPHAQTRVRPNRKKSQK